MIVGKEKELDIDGGIISMSIKVVPELAPNVYYVGVEDWDRRIFDALIPLPLGTSYNAYLIVGKEKTALVDTVQRNFSGDLLAKIRQIVDPSKIDYVIMNHAEPDHAGSIPEVLAAAPNAKLVVSKLGADMANIFHNVPAERAQIVKEGDTLDLGGKTLRFIDAPWLHWPETMFTYLVEDKILLPCDFFGAHMAKNKLYDDEVSEVLLPDAKRYYAEIMMPFPVAIQRALDKVKALDIKMIAPSHGPIYRNPKRILDAYEMWARGPLKPKVVLMYVTMWGSTEALEKTIAESIAAEGVEVVPYNLLVSDISHVMMDLVDASAIVIGAPTVLNGAHPVALTATLIIRALKPRAKLAAVFGSYGWGRGAVKMISESLQQAGFEITETLEVRGPPKKEDREKAISLGKHVAQKVKESTEI
jgi:flavorubredoxin